MGGARWLADDVVTALVPAIRAEILLVQRNIEISSLQLTHHGGVASVTLDANLAYPLYVESVLVNPLGWNPPGSGYFEVTTSAHGVLLAPLVLLLGVVVWPALSASAMVLRLLVSAPLLAVLMMLDVPLDLLGTFLHAAIHHAGLDPLIPLFYWAQFLEGGGNMALALAFAVAAIAMTGRIRPPDIPVALHDP